MVVNEGNLDTGNECLYICERNSEKWIKFDEAMVEFRSMDQCIEEVQKNSNKYYLIYTETEFIKSQ